MRKFYFMNWMILLMGLISSTALGQTTVTSNFGAQNGNIGSDNTITYFSEQTNSSYWNPLRVYANTSFGVQADNQATILAISLTYDTSSYFKVTNTYYAGESSSNTSVIPSSGITESNPTREFTFDVTDNVKYFYFTSSAQVRLKSISVTYELPTANEPPVITTEQTTIEGVFGGSLSFAVSANNNPTSWTATNLPQGITFDNGVFSGTYEKAGTFTATVTATNDYGSDQKDFTFEVAKAEQQADLDHINGFVGDIQELPATTDQGVAISYELSGDEVATLDGNTLTLVAEGNTNLIARAEGNENLEDFIQEFMVEVTEQPVFTGCFEEKFDDITTGNSITTGGSGTKWNGNENFPTVSTAYQAGGAVKLGTGSNTGSITSKALSNIQGDVNVTFDVKGWTSIEGTMLVSLGSQTETVTYKAKMADDFETVTLHFSNVEANSTITFATSAKRAFLDNISVCNAGETEPADQTTWNGTAWTNGLPTAQKNVVVSGALEIAENLNAKSFTIQTEGSVIVKTGHNLIVEGVIENKANAAAFVIENNANILQAQDVANIGEVTILRNSTPMVRNDMTLWSAPVTGQGVRAFSPETLFNRFWTYDEVNYTYKKLFDTDDAADIDFATGKGYAIRVKNTLAAGTETVHQGKFIGNLNNGTYIVSVSKEGYGFNLVGNPYASSIDGKAFLDENSDNVNSVHFWTHEHAVGTAEFTNNYLTYNRAGGTDLVLDDLENIASGQGFFVEADKTGTIVFNNEMRTKNEAVFHKNNIERNRVWLSLSNDNKVINNTLLAYMTGATNGIDKQMDAKSITSDITSLYQVINNEAYSIQSRSLPFNQEDKVALGFNAVAAGTYTISIAKTDGLFAEGQAIFLVDKQTNTVHDLATPYTFQATEGVNNDRFVVVYENRTMGTNNFFNQAQVAVYNQNNQVVVEAKNNLSSVEVIDVQGRVVYAKANINGAKHIISTSAKGVLIVKATTQDGQVHSQKVIIK